MIPDNVREIIEELHSHGHEAFVVGGPVRDLVMGKVPDDWDLATSAWPGQVEAIFGGAAESTVNSRAHGTVFVRNVDVTTFRTDHDEDGTRARVQFAASIIEDQCRRDFTFNGMALGLDGQIHDPFGGKADIANHVVRAIGDPNDRIQESWVRMLRACRFCALHPAMTMAHDLFTAIIFHNELIRGVPAELVQRELCKLLAYPAPGNGLYYLRQTGLLDILLPQLAACVGVSQRGTRHAFDVWNHTLATVDAAPEHIRLAALFHDTGKALTALRDGDRDRFHGHEAISVHIARGVMKRLHFSNDQVRYVTTLVREHMFTACTPRAMRRLLRRLGDVPIEDLLALRNADRVGQDGKPRTDGCMAQRALVAKILGRADALQVTDLVIGGHDLIALGWEPGPLFGRVLTALLEEVIDNPQKNEREYLLDRAASLIL